MAVVERRKLNGGAGTLCFPAWVPVPAVLLLVVLVGGGIRGAEGFVGIYWGRYATQSLVPSVVVDLLQQNGLTEIRLSAPSVNVMEALQSSSLGVTVAIQSDFIRRMKWNNIRTIDDWVAELLVVPVKRGVNIKTLVILEEPYMSAGGRIPITNATDVFKEAVASLQNHGLSHVRTTTIQSPDILKIVKKPSESDFRDEYKTKMLEYLSLYNRTHNSFYMYNLYPLTSLVDNNWPLEFAFMDNNSSFSVVDGPYTYTNIFEFLFDALVVAVEKAGFPDMEIVVGEIGWPTDGGQYATPENAERFHRGFLKHIVQKKGTPRRPNMNIDVFLGTLLDENKFPLLLGAYRRHRGIYNFDGVPKFKIDFSGQGRDIYPSTAKGIVKMPSRWCIFNGDMSNATKVEEQMQFACATSDCTPLYSHSTCSNLNHTWNVSYAFNVYYQSNNQELDNGACDFSGLGVLTPFDPSTGTCQFPVEILTAEKVDGGIQLLNYVGYGSGPRGTTYSIALSFFVIFLSMLLL
ncbi:unnamed protein product [Cuscuta europaea]|uniref:X8 domain-containing protein n=1 Tax=Cuscuta europaea TaxID=41803 RepID=A0A9P1EBC6_CUSEU|nr:unnamed protein product [Cuscuta europaea]